MGNSGLKQHYQTAAKTGLLKISNEKLKELPPEVKPIRELIRNLDISDNKFHALPDDIVCFAALKQLNVAHNRIETLPSNIGRLSKLDHLNVSFNLITRLPEEFAQLVNLKQLHIADNRLVEFPVVVCELKHLDVLEVSRNRITSVPPQVGRLRVSELNANGNQISSIADEISSCARLKVLRLEENCLPLSAITTALLRDSKVHTLCLDGNLFDAKQLANVDGYDDYMSRFTAVKKKMF